jgi:endonuclease/exonuclease/phosphatase family metal-dependent hydrolase
MDWWLTSVYCPPRDADKPAFITELQELRSLCSGPWLLTGDFNMIYRAEDKNNNRLNRQLMGQFRHFINEADLKELHLNGRLFTWSNERTHPTLERIDRAFISKEWDELYPYNDLHSLSSMCSDHAPLPLRMDNLFIYKKRFHFCCFWTRFPATRRSSSGHGNAP